MSDSVGKEQVRTKAAKHTLTLREQRKYKMFTNKINTMYVNSAECNDQWSWVSSLF